VNDGRRGRGGVLQRDLSVATKKEGGISRTSGELKKEKALTNRKKFAGEGRKKRNVRGGGERARKNKSWLPVSDESLKRMKGKSEILGSGKRKETKISQANQSKSGKNPLTGRNLVRREKKHIHFKTSASDMFLKTKLFVAHRERGKKQWSVTGKPTIERQNRSHLNCPR